MFPGYSERTEYDAYGVATTYFYETGTDESGLYTDYAKRIDTTYKISADVSFLRLLVKIGNEPEMVCIAKRHSSFQSEGVFHRTGVLGWQIYDVNFMYPKRSMSDEDKIIKPKFVLNVIGKYKNKEDAELNFKEDADLLLKQRTELNLRFLLQLNAQDVAAKLESFIGTHLFKFLSYIDFIKLRAVCRIPIPKNGDYPGRTALSKLNDVKVGQTALSYYKNGELSSALRMFQDMLAERRKLLVGYLGTNETASLEYNIGSILLTQDKAPEALTYLRSSYNTRELVLDKDDEKTKKAKDKLNACNTKIKLATPKNI